MTEWIPFISAAVSGGIFTEIVRKLIPTRDVVMDIQVKRDAESAKVESDLRKALWDEIQRLTVKIKHLEDSLDQTRQTMEALRSENIILKAELELVSKRLDFKLKEIV